MNVFEAVKQNVTARQTAERYGIKVNRNGMAVCPFHNDRNPSLKLDRRFHCFGCQADGDAVDFVSRLFGLQPKDAALKLAQDFGIRLETRLTSAPVKQRASPIREQITMAQEYRKAEEHCFRVLCGYLHLLKDWKVRYAPQSPEEEWHPLFCEALQKTVYIEYLLDTLLSGDIRERAAVVKEQGKEVLQLERRISELAANRAESRDGCGEADQLLLHFKSQPAHAVDERSL